jgi:hypothetical protein
MSVGSVSHPPHGRRKRVCREKIIRAVLKDRIKEMI